MKKNEILRVYGTDYKNMTKRLLTQADLISDIPKGAVRIGIKPNLVTPTPASYGATTHPEIVAGIIEYLQSFRKFEIVIAEGSWVGDKTSEAFEYCGYHALAEQYGVQLLDTQKDRCISVACLDTKNNSGPAKTFGGKKHLFRKEGSSDDVLNICSCVNDFDYLINVPVLKGHCQTKITCALKNMKGLIPNSEKRRFHTMGLHKPIAYLNTCIRQDFIVIDHICGDLDFEEGGNPVTRNCIMVAKDPVLTDAYVCKLLGYETKDVKYVAIAEQIGIGSGDLDSMKMITLQGAAVPFEEKIAGDDVTENAAEAADGSGAETFLHQPGRKLLSVSYAVNEIDSCSACYGMLIPALTRLKEEGLLDLLDVPIAIGQGHRGKNGTLGVGSCTRQFDYCVEGCPPNEEEIYNGLKAYITSAR